jgi:hypothetical protein
VVRFFLAELGDGRAEVLLVGEVVDVRDDIEPFLLR